MISQIGYYHLPIAVVFVQLSDDSSNDVQCDERRYHNDRFDRGLSHCCQDRVIYCRSTTTLQRCRRYH